MTFGITTLRLDKASLLYTNIDILLLQVQTEDAYKDMHEYAEDFDFSKYPVNGPYYNEENKRVVCKFTDECKGNLNA